MKAMKPPLCIELAARPESVHVRDEDAHGFAARRAGERETAAQARGRSEGATEVLQRTARALDRASLALEETRREALDAVAHDSAELAIAIASEIVRSEIAFGRHDIERLVRETLAASGVGRASCVVHLHPSDAARLAGVAFRAGTTLEADSEIAIGDVHVTSARGVCVREVDELLAAIRERLREEAA